MKAKKSEGRRTRTQKAKDIIRPAFLIILGLRSLKFRSATQMPDEMMQVLSTVSGRIHVADEEKSPRWSVKARRTLDELKGKATRS